MSRRWAFLPKVGTWPGFSSYELFLVFFLSLLVCQGDYFLWRAVFVVYLGFFLLQFFYQ